MPLRHLERAEKGKKEEVGKGERRLVFMLSTCLPLGRRGGERVEKEGRQPSFTLRSRRPRGGRGRGGRGTRGGKQERNNVIHLTA